MTAEKTPLLVSNMTNEFLSSEYSSGVVLERARKMVPVIRKLQETFISKGQPVIYLTDRHLETDYEISKWGKHSMKGSEGSRIVGGLLRNDIYTLERRWKPWDFEQARIGNTKLFEIEKGTYSGFTDNGGHHTALHGLLEALNVHPGNTIYLTGLHTNGGILHTAADAWFRGYHPAIVSDCTDAFDNTDGKLGMDHSAALKYMQYWYQAGTLKSDEVLEEINIPSEKLEIH